MIPVLLSWPCPTYPTCVCHLWPSQIIQISIIGPAKSNQQHTVERVKALHWKKWWSGGPFDVLCNSFYMPPMSSGSAGIRNLFDHYPLHGGQGNGVAFIIRGNNCLSSKVVLLLVLYCNIVPPNIEKEGKSTLPMARQGFPGFLSWRRIPALSIATVTPPLWNIELSKM